MKALEMDEAFLTRSVNEGFSGGEKKRNEILQLSLLEPALAVLDETDSGLDIDALRIVADGVNRLRSRERAVLAITHYQRLLDYLVPDRTHVLIERAHREVGRPEPGARAGEARLRVHRGGSEMTSAASAFARALAAPRAEREPIWLAGLRAEARDAFLAHGLPTTRDEDWRYTPLAKLDKIDVLESAPGSFSGATSLREVLNRDPERVHRVLGVCGDPKRRPFEALNTALFTDGAWIDLAPGADARAADPPARRRWSRPRT